MHAEIDPRYSDQQEHRRTHDPNAQAHTSRLDPRREDRCQGAEENSARQRVSTRKTVRFRRREIEERHRPRALERELERDIQQPRADHR